jgi:hypothetical protein
LRKTPISPIGDDWNEIRKSLLIPEERIETDLKVALLDEIIKARQSRQQTNVERIGAC